MATDREMLEVVNGLYTAAIGDESWDGALCGLADFCGAESAALVRADQLIQHSSVAAPRVDSAIINAYNEHWWVEDPTDRENHQCGAGRPHYQPGRHGARCLLSERLPQ